MTRNLEAALREARNTFYDMRHNAMFSTKDTLAQEAERAYFRIDAAIRGAKP